MSITRTVRAEQPGPIRLTADLPSSDLHVSADTNIAEVTISTPDDEGPSADAVNAATLTARGDTVEVRLPQGVGGTTIVQTGRAGRSISVGQNFGVVAGNVTGMIMTGGGQIIVNGQVVSGNSVIVGGSPITVEAHVPADSSVRAKSISGDVTTSGRLDTVDASSTSGDVEVDEARTVHANTTSGDITISLLAGRATCNSVSGDVEVHGGPQARCDARTVSGNVRGTGGIDLDASTVSGRVRNR